MLPGGIHDAVEVKRFTTKRKPLQFYVDDDLFNGIPALPALQALELTKVQTALQEGAIEAKIDAMLSIFSQFMDDQSFERFRSRLSDKSNPIDLTTMLDVIQWVLGEGYGLRPTQKPSPSVTSPSDSGQPLTGGVLPEALTLSTSPGVASST